MENESRISTWHNRVMLLTGGTSTFLGLLALTGWHTHNTTLIQVLPTFVPMQYNTALGFLLCGMGLLSVALGKGLLATTCGAVTGTIGLLTLIEYIFGLDLWIDQILMTHYIMVETSSPGRMAPNTALCFSLVAAALLIMGGVKPFRRRPLLVGGLAALTFVLGVVAFMGYLTGASTAYGWGHLTRMAVHTASGFMVLGMGILAVAYREERLSRRNSTNIPTRPRAKVLVLSTIIMTVVTLITALNVVRELHHVAIEQKRAELLTLVTSWAETTNALDQFDSTRSQQDDSESAEATTLGHVTAALEGLSGVGGSREFVLARREGDQIVFLLSSQRTLNRDHPQAVPFDSDRAEPMRRALLGESGTLIGLDYAGEAVLAAYAPFGQYGWGLVRKIDMAEIGEPFVRASLLACGVGLAIVVLGALALLFTVDPLIRGLAARTSELHREVAEHKRAEEALRESEASLKALVEGVQTAIVVHDSTGNILLGNQRARQLLEPLTKDIDGKGLSDTSWCFFYEDGTEVPIEEFPVARILDTREAIDGLLLGLRERNGKEMRWLLVNGVPVVEEDGHLSKVIISFVDITDRMRAEEALRESEERFRTLVANIPGASYRCLVDAHWTMLFISDEVEAISGYPASDFVQNRKRSYASIVLPEDARIVDEISMNAVERKEPFSIEYRVVRADGELRWVFEKGQGIFDDQGETVCLDGVIVDITDRKRAEEALRLTQFSLDHSSDAAYWMGPDARFFYVNDASCRALGYTREELLTMTVHDIGPEFPVEVWPAHWANLKAHGSFVIETTHRAKQGNVFPVEIALNFVEFDGKEYNCAFARDITERKRAEEAYRAVVDHSLQGLAILCGTKVLFANKALATMSGYTVEEMLALLPEQVQGLFHSDDSEMVLKRAQDRLAGQSPPRQYEVRAIKKDGALMWAELFCTLIQYQGQPAVQVAAVDITERKQAEEALRESELRYHQMFETNQAAKLIIDPEDGRIVESNEAAQRFYGYDAQALASLRIMDLNTLTEAEVRQEMERATIEERSFFSFSHRLASGEIRSVEVYSGPLRSSGRALLYSIIHDVTKRKRVEEQIAASLKEKEVLLREIHHRVKNNMQVIVSLLRMHARRSRSERIRNVFDDCRDRVNAMSLIHEALYQSEDLARIDSESYLAKLCRNLSQVHGASSRGIVLTVERENVSLGMDQGVAVGMIVCELVSNIFKHAFPEGESGAVSVSLSGVGEEEVELVVQDDGVGLPPEIDILNSPSLGLHLVGITTTHELGGSIEVERDGGTRFVIRFKRKDI